MSAFKKIMIFGCPGSGKSTLALDLHKMLKLPVYHLDRYFFEANWEPRNYQEFLQIQQHLVDSESWIIDGNSSKSLEIRYKTADLVLYLNYPKGICYFRTIKRLFNKNPEIKDRAEGCKEIIRWDLLRYMWSYEKRIAHVICTLKEKYPDTLFIEIKNDKELLQFKADLDKKSA